MRYLGCARSPGRDRGVGCPSRRQRAALSGGTLARSVPRPRILVAIAGGPAMRFGYPGVYVEEVPSGAHAIAGVPTSTAAFVGATKFGPVTEPLLVHSFAEFEAHFGGLSADMPLGYAVQHFFLNGGRDALIARVEPAGPALIDADLSGPALEQQRRGL